MAKYSQIAVDEGFGLRMASWALKKVQQQQGGKQELAAVMEELTR
jgi:hypothetical protein